MGILLKIMAAGACILLFVYCMRKKTPDPGLEGWLEKHYPGRFQIVSTQSDEGIRNLSFKVKKSVVAEASNPMVQALLRYDLRQADLKLDTAEVNALFARSAEVWEDAQALQGVLESGAYENWAAGIRNGVASLLVWEEPSPDRRKEWAQRMERALLAWPAAGEYDKELLFVEPVGMADHEGKIVPLNYWLEYDGQYTKQVVFRLFCPYDRPFRAADLAREWQFNADSDRFTRYLEQTRDAVEKWAGQHLKQPYEWLDLTEYEKAQQSPETLRFSFLVTSETIPDGRIEAEFDVDRGEVRRIWVGGE
jgi:hypothetical protein